MAAQTLSTWEEILQIAQSQTTARRVHRPGEHPSTAPIPSSLRKLAVGETPPVLLYRDTNSWCPFCERVWFALEEKEIPFETEFIDLSNKHPAAVFCSATIRPQSVINPFTKVI